MKLLKGLIAVAASFAVAWAASLAVLRAATPEPAAPPGSSISYARDIRPILSEYCYACHGPDGDKRKAGLRLDLQDSALKELKSGNRAIVPGDVAHSALIERINTADEDDHMPPAETGKKLSKQQIELLNRWIADGAKGWQGLWSLVPPERPATPAVKAAGWVRNPIDTFVLARLEKERLSPTREADKETLIRRLTLDLTGLPPTPKEIDAFLADSSPSAYEKVVDRLLANPHYGERMALDWLDAARFADTHGYHIDAGRNMTLWRDWLIGAFNRNVPFDRFTVEQIAGDLLPSATLEQKIASGFNRNNMVNFEGGAIAEEYQTAYVLDRVNTTGSTWLGLTVGCTQCHDHKFDPITQKEFYQFYAFFNNVAENGLDGRKGNAVPLLEFPSPEQSKKLAAMRAEVAEMEKVVNGPRPELQAAWEKAELARGTQEGVIWEPCKVKAATSKGGATLAQQDDLSVRVTGTNPATDSYDVLLAPAPQNVTGVRLEVLPDDGLAAKGSGRSANGNVVLTEVTLGTSTDPAGVPSPVKIKTVTADFSQDTFPVTNAVDGNPGTGWAIYPEVGRQHIVVFEPEQPINLTGGATLHLRLDFGSQFPRHTLGRFRVSVTTAKNPHLGPKAPANILAILQTPQDQRTDKQKSALRRHYSTSSDIPLGRKMDADLAIKKKELAAYAATIPNTMVMAERETPRDTFVLLRGQYDRHGEKVTPGVPACLPPLPTGAPANRLGLAQWLVDPKNPLVSRVIVNRYWQLYFGTGIVKTAEDFGTQGEFPSHPELLDWLATEFVRTGWDVKAMQRLIVTSATYRQASAATPALVARDPENRLLARGARFRLAAELVRDQALAVSGLLNDEIGGKSVSPYQPAGLWEELMSRADGANWTAQVYAQDHGKDLYRRGMYTFWKRTSPPASLTTFDAPSRETCTVRRSRTNTPLQALVLMNDPTYVEAARKLAERMLTEGGARAEDRIAFAFRLATARKPRPEELTVLKGVLEKQLAKYRDEPYAAETLLNVGESKRDESLDKPELAASAVVASVILNLDEVVTKN